MHYVQAEGLAKDPLGDGPADPQEDAQRSDANDQGNRQCIKPREDCHGAWHRSFRAALLAGW